MIALCAAHESNKSPLSPKSIWKSADLSRFHIDFNPKGLSDRELNIVTPIASAIPQLTLVEHWETSSESVSEYYFSLIDPAKLSGCAELLEREIPADVAPRSDGGTEQGTEVGQKTRRRGRKPKYDAEEDAKLADAWLSGRYRTRKQLAREMGMPVDDVKRALDRDRHRRPERRKEASRRKKSSE